MFSFGGFGGDGGGGRPGPNGQVFTSNYRVYPVSFLPNKEAAEHGDKIVMPPSALDTLARLHVTYPMLFEVSNNAKSRRHHCGVLEFIAEEGTLFIPYWMMQNLLLEEGDLVQVKSVTIPKGSYVKLQPQTMDFFDDISNPKAVLESALRTYSCLTKESWIQIHYNNKNYQVDIIDTKPSNAISIIETDVTVDFSEPPGARKQDKGKSAAGSSRPAGGGPLKPLAVNPIDDMAAPAQASKFTAFTGTGYSIKGKKVEEGAPSSAAAAAAAMPPSAGAGRPSIKVLKFPRPSAGTVAKAAAAAAAAAAAGTAPAAPGPGEVFPGQGQRLKK